MSDYSKMSDQELEDKLKSLKQIQRIVGIIFALIILAWFILGYWRTNTPVFISTVVLALFIYIFSGRGAGQISAELDRRQSS